MQAKDSGGISKAVAATAAPAAEGSTVPFYNNNTNKIKKNPKEEGDFTRIKGEKSGVVLVSECNDFSTCFGFL